MPFDFPEENVATATLAAQNRPIISTPQGPARAAKPSPSMAYMQPLPLPGSTPLVQQQAAQPYRYVSPVTAELAAAAQAAQQAVPVAMNASLAARLESLVQQNIKYTLLEGWEPLPFSLPDRPMLLLFEPVELFTKSVIPLTQDQIHDHTGKDRGIVHLLGLKPIGNPAELTYLLSDGKAEQRITLVPKGAGLFPTTFETRLLNARYGHNRVVSVSTAETLTPGILWHRLHRQKWLAGIDDSLRNLLIQYVDRIVGPPTTCSLPQFS